MWSYLFQQEEIGSISSRHYVSEKGVRRILDLYLSTGDVSPRKQRSGPVRKLFDREELQLHNAIFENPGIYLDELQAVLQHDYGMIVSLAVSFQTLKKMGLT